MAMEQMPHVGPEEAVRLAGEEGAVLLDVREQEEWDAGHAPAALHVAMSTLSGRADDIPTDRLIVCVCRSGGRSAAVTEALLNGGWKAVNLEGGMHAWEAAQLPVLDDRGQPGKVV
jgi:rhodanese-related sulfurtransferase